MLILGIETSCDETAVAVVELSTPKGPARIRANLIASQHEVHTPYGGIVPELASRRHIEILQAMTAEATQGVGLKNIEGVAVTSLPGLVGSLLVGVSFAKSLAYALKVPFIGVNHLEGHLNASLLENLPRRNFYPQIALLVSGGHTALYVIKRFGHYDFLGGTLDDAAGEAFDKVAKILGLGYPGGPAIDKLAREGNPSLVSFPKPRVDGFNFSFSGLKTAVKQIAGPGDQPADMAASFQEVVVDSLIEKTVLAARRKRCRTIALSGGVACNSRLREKFGEIAKEKKLKLYFPTPLMSTDNAAMIAYVGGRHLLEGKRSPLSLNALANTDLKKLSDTSVSA